MRILIILFIISSSWFSSTTVLAVYTLPDMLAQRYSTSKVIEGNFRIKAPKIAENGAVVSVIIDKLELPAADVFVKEIALYAKYNQEKPVAVFRFARSVSAEGLKTRIKLSKTTDIIAVASLSNGKIMVAHQAVKITIGGCGGGGYAGSSGAYEGGTSPTAHGAYSRSDSKRRLAEESGRAQGHFQAGILTAADIDDNLNYTDFQRYLSRYHQQVGQLSRLPVNLSGRVTLKVRDVYGQGVSHAKLRVVSPPQQATVLDTYTGSDGVVQFYPKLTGVHLSDHYLLKISTSAQPSHQYTIALDMRRLSSDRMFDIRLQNDTAALPDALDLMLVIDTTGSMTDELNYLTREFKAIVAAIRTRHPSIDIRFGLVVFRDKGDEYVVRHFDFTRSVDEMQVQLQRQYASGGGDMPEAMDQALDVAVNTEWRPGNVSRVMFLVADAPPHAYGESRMLNLAINAKQLGVKIYSLAASGVDDRAEYLMRLSSAITQGRYLFLTDDSGVGNKHAEPHVACYIATRLDNLMIRVVASELSGKRIEAEKEQILRQVGVYNRGSCQRG